MLITIEVTETELNSLRAHYERRKWLVTLKGESFSPLDRVVEKILKEADDGELEVAHSTES